MFKSSINPIKPFISSFTKDAAVPRKIANTNTCITLPSARDAKKFSGKNVKIKFCDSGIAELRIGFSCKFKFC